MEQRVAQIIYSLEQKAFVCSGLWTVLRLDSINQKFKQSDLPKNQKVMIDGEGIAGFDSAGALAIVNCVEELKKKENQVELRNFTKEQRQLIELIETKKETINYKVPSPKTEGILYHIGKESENKLLQVDGLVVLIGDISSKIFEAFGYWRKFHLPSIVSNIDSTGLKALPILALLAFLIGVVLAYQMGLQLENYGANTYIAYFSGMAIFREFGPLITAIIVAGRTSSAFTAQIGSMKINEEVDAILTMGLSPTELLVLPKLLGLLFVFPLLIFWSDVFSVLGAMFMSQSMLHISFVDFLTRLQEGVGFKQMMLGIYKAPAYAILIALVGCFQGFSVKSSADSIGSQTTKSVVQALFLIIIADSVYSVIYSWMDL